MSKVILLEKKEGQTWSQAEVTALVNRSTVEIEQLPGKPHRLAVMNKPLGESIEKVLASSTFTTREVDYRDRWS
jgi:hypothetical protein